MRSGKPKPAGAEHRLEKALAAIASALRAARVPWMVIGGIASIAQGVRRRGVLGNDPDPAVVDVTRNSDVDLNPRGVVVARGDDAGAVGARAT